VLDLARDASVFAADRVSGVLDFVLNGVVGVHGGEGARHGGRAPLSIAASVVAGGGKAVFATTLATTLRSSSAAYVDAMDDTNRGDAIGALSAAVEQALATLQAVEQALPPNPRFTSKEKKRTGKLRKGGQGMAKLIGTLARQYDLEPPALPANTIDEQLEVARVLGPLLIQLLALAKHVGDLTFSAESVAWQRALQLYALLQRRARADGSLAANLAPVADFLAYRHKSTGTEPPRDVPQEGATLAP
jgi:hypothetical protein